MKVAGIVVCNPDYDRLMENIRAIHSQVDLLAIYLNSEIDKSRFLIFDKIHYLNDGNNKGIATALNEIMSYAAEIDAQWCLLLDQDSVVPENCIEEFEKNTGLECAAILTPYVHDDRDMEEPNAVSESYTEIDMCISSGSYNNVEIWKKCKAFRDEFFIDYVDWEYCARVRSKGYKVYCINKITINHQLGKKSYHQLFGKKVFTYNHSAFRKYYITRNTIVSYRLYPSEIKLAHPYLRTWKRLMLTLFFEDNKIKKTGAIMRGIMDSGKLYSKLREKQEYGN